MHREHPPRKPQREAARQEVPAWKIAEDIRDHINHIKDGVITVEIEIPGTPNVWVGDYRLTKPETGILEFVPGSSVDDIDWPPTIMVAEASDIAIQLAAGGDTTPASSGDRPEPPTIPTPEPGEVTAGSLSINEEAPGGRKNEDAESEKPGPPHHKVCTICGRDYSLRVDYCFADGDPLATVDQAGKELVAAASATRRQKNTTPETPPRTAAPAPPTPSKPQRPPRARGKIPVLGLDSLKPVPDPEPRRATTPEDLPVLGKPAEDTEPTLFERQPRPQPTTGQPPMGEPHRLPALSQEKQPTPEMIRVHVNQAATLAEMQRKLALTKFWQVFKRADLKSKIARLEGVRSRRLAKYPGLEAALPAAAEIPPAPQVPGADEHPQPAVDQPAQRMPEEAMVDHHQRQLNILARLRAEGSPKTDSLQRIVDGRIRLYPGLANMTAQEEPAAKTNDLRTAAGRAQELAELNRQVKTGRLRGRQAREVGGKIVQLHKAEAAVELGVDKPLPESKEPPVVPELTVALDPKNFEELRDANTTGLGNRAKLRRTKPPWFKRSARKAWNESWRNNEARIAEAQRLLNNHHHQKRSQAA